MKSREIFDSIDHVSDLPVHRSRARLLPSGAVLVVIRGMILARTVPAAILRVPAAINQDMKALVPGAEVLSGYLCAYLRAINGQLLSLVEKSTHDTRKLQTLSPMNIKLPLPSIDRQEDIVAELYGFLSELESLRLLQEKSSSELDVLLPTILDPSFKEKL